MAKYIRYKDIAKYPVCADHCDKKNANKAFIFGIESVMEYIENLPKFEVDEIRAEREHGRWVRDTESVYFKNGYECCRYYCSICGEESDDYQSNYCPFCGARMGK